MPSIRHYDWKNLRKNCRQHARHFTLLVHKGDYSCEAGLESAGNNHGQVRVLRSTGRLYIILGFHGEKEMFARNTTSGIQNEASLCNGAKFPLKQQCHMTFKVVMGTKQNHSTT